MKNHCHKFLIFYTLIISIFCSCSNDPKLIRTEHINDKDQIFVYELGACPEMRSDTSDQCHLWTDDEPRLNVVLKENGELYQILVCNTVSGLINASKFYDDFYGYADYLNSLGSRVAVNSGFCTIAIRDIGPVFYHAPGFINKQRNKKTTINPCYQFIGLKKIPEKIEKRISEIQEYHRKAYKNPAK